jgi:hypothetical protein
VGRDVLKVFEKPNAGHGANLLIAPYEETLNRRQCLSNAVCASLSLALNSAMREHRHVIEGASVFLSPPFTVRNPLREHP